MKGVPRTLTLTSGTDSHTAGAHSRREAVDVRTKSFRGRMAAWNKRRLIFAVLNELGTPRFGTNEEDPEVEVFTDQYYGVLEHEGKASEHIHIQVRRGQTIGLEATA